MIQVPNRKFLLKSQQHRFTNWVVGFISSEPSHLLDIEKFSFGQIALAVYNSKPLIIGKIIEINQGGLCLDYINIGRPLYTENYSKIEILCAECKFYMKNVPFTETSDLVAAEGLLNDNKVEYRRKEFIFDNLSNKQRLLLNEFIKNHQRMISNENGKSY